MALWNKWICNKACQVIMLTHIDLFTHMDENKVMLKIRKKRGIKGDERLALRKVKERW